MFFFVSFFLIIYNGRKEVELLQALEDPRRGWKSRSEASRPWGGLISKTTQTTKITQFSIPKWTPPQKKKNCKNHTNLKKKHFNICITWMTMRVILFINELHEELCPNFWLAVSSSCKTFWCTDTKTLARSKVSSPKQQRSRNYTNASETSAKDKQTWFAQKV